MNNHFLYFPLCMGAFVIYSYSAIKSEDVENSYISMPFFHRREFQARFLNKGWNSSFKSRTERFLEKSALFVATREVTRGTEIRRRERERSKSEIDAINYIENLSYIIKYIWIHNRYCPFC